VQAHYFSTGTVLVDDDDTVVVVSSVEQVKTWSAENPDASWPVGRDGGVVIAIDAYGQADVEQADNQAALGVEDAVAFVQSVAEPVLTDGLRAVLAKAAA
jgi:hypothetical protein